MKNNYSHFGLKDEDQKEYAEAFGENPETFRIEPRKQATIDGYCVGERLLEGIQFIITVHDDGTLSAETPEDAKLYMDDLNEEKWLKKVVEEAKTRDMFEGLDGVEDINLIMDDGRYNFELDEEKNPKQCIPIKINKINFLEL